MSIRSTATPTLKTSPLATGFSGRHPEKTKGGFGRVAALGAAWLGADRNLETLTLRWSDAESKVMRAQDPALVDALRSSMQRLERRIAGCDRRRSGLLDRLLLAPSISQQDVLTKLVVATRLLEGEGGPEYDLVADAIGWMSEFGGLRGAKSPHPLP